MNTYTPIQSLEPSPKIEQIFMIEQASQRYAGNNKPFVQLKLRDVTGHVSSCIWNAKLTPQLAAGRFITIDGKIETYGDGLQVTVKSWQPYSGSPPNLSDYVYCPNPNVIKVYLAELDTFIDSMEDADYRDIVRNACERLQISQRMSESPYGFEGRLAYRGGLLMHTVYLLRTIKGLFEAFSDSRNGLNRDLLIAGVIFRNLGWWVIALPEGNIFTAGDISSFMGLRFASAMLANHTCLHVESDMNVKLDLIKKLSLQQIAFAEETTPNLTPEAILILRAEAIVDSVEFTI